MIRSLAAALLTLLSCASLRTSTSSAPPTAEPPEEELHCLPYHFYGLYSGMYGVCHSDHVSSYCADFYAKIGRRPFEAAHAAASLAHAAGNGSHTTISPVAAAHFLECARAYRSVPEHDPLWNTALKNMTACYSNYALALANAGRFASQGRAVLEQERIAEPRLASAITEILNKPLSECTAPRPAAANPQASGPPNLVASPPR
jgi:hypothetical protein